MSDITNIDKVMRSAPEAIKQIRKPEARSPYSDVLAETMREYLNEIFNQQSPPEAIQALKQRHGLMLFEGSVLRGTATEKTGDFDIFSMVDDQPMDGEMLGNLAIATRDIGDYHPNKQKFPEYLVNRLRTNANTPYYDARIAEIQRRHDIVEGRWGRPPSPARMEPHDFIHLDPEFNHLQNFLQAIDTADSTVLQDTSTRMIVSLLTASPDMVFEITPGALQYYQQRLVEALIQLQRKDPVKFDTFYSQLAKDFVNLYESTSWRYPGRDFKLLAEYYLRSGRFRPQHIQERQLVDIVAQKLTNEAVRDDTEYQHKRHHQYYQEHPEKLMEDQTRKFESETGLARDELEKIAKGENLLEPEEQKLSPEAQEEIRKFAKRVKLLAAIRSQTKMPTLEEFKQAYLVTP